MIYTRNSDDIKDFLDFLTKMLGKPEAEKRMGASEEEISEFIGLARLPLPKLYVGYLREFGQRDPVLKMAYDANSEVRSLIALYKEERGKSDTQIPADGVVIGDQTGLVGQLSLLYSENAKNGLSEPTVAITWWGDFGNTVAENFRNHLYGQAFACGRLKKGSTFVLYQNGDTLFESSLQTARSSGFEPYWFSDRWNTYLENPTDVFLNLARTQRGIAVYGAAESRNRLDAVKNNLLRLGLLES